MIAIIDHEEKRTLVLKKGLLDAGAWSPWDRKSKARQEFGVDDYKSMLCLDSAAIGTQLNFKTSIRRMEKDGKSYLLPHQAIAVRSLNHERFSMDDPGQF